jgi:hypothetical protein
MGKRITRVKDKYECRFAGGCPAEEWICACSMGGELISNPCDNCPFEQYINKLADYEDKYQPVDDGTEVYLLILYYDCKYAYKCPLGVVDGYKCEIDERCSHEFIQYAIKTVPFEAEKHASQWGITVFASEEEARAEYEKNILKKEGK